LKILTSDHHLLKYLMCGFDEQEMGNFSLHL
jgi:hypothetical protein